MIPESVVWGVLIMSASIEILVNSVYACMFVQWRGLYYSPK